MTPNLQIQLCDSSLLTLDLCGLFVVYSSGSSSIVWSLHCWGSVWFWLLPLTSLLSFFWTRPNSALTNTSWVSPDLWPCNVCVYACWGVFGDLKPLNLDFEQSTSCVSCSEQRHRRVVHLLARGSSHVGSCSDSCCGCRHRCSGSAVVHPTLSPPLLPHLLEYDLHTHLSSLKYPSALNNVIINELWLTVLPECGCYSVEQTQYVRVHRAATSPYGQRFPKTRIGENYSTFSHQGPVQA